MTFNNTIEKIFLYLKHNLEFHKNSGDNDMVYENEKIIKAIKLITRRHNSFS